jgi:hypothetical protein
MLKTLLYRYYKLTIYNEKIILYRNITNSINKF